MPVWTFLQGMKTFYWKKNTIAYTPHPYLSNTQNSTTALKYNKDTNHQEPEWDKQLTINGFLF